ncbi:RNA polymerase sigma factor [Pseudonocardia sichuanensis]
MGDDVGALLRELAPQVLAALVRHHGRFDACEDAVQEALLAAAVQWGENGVPESPRGWLITVGARRLTDQLRSDAARRRREENDAARLPSEARVSPAADAVRPAADDTLTLLFLCCHPTLSPPSQVALTLRAVGGLTTAEIARAFLTPEATMAQRISRAKQQIKAAGGRFAPPAPAERPQRLGAVLHVLYLVFNEGYLATSGPDVHRGELTGEAIRLARQVRRLLPDDGEVAGLLALMLLTEARRAARTRDDGSVVPLAEQDRGRWDRAAISEGTALLTEVLNRTPIGPYQIQAAIAAVHSEADRAENTDWPQILALYDLLVRFEPGPVPQLNRAVAVAMVRGPRAGLDLLEELERDRKLAGHHRLHAVRAHLLELHGDREAARTAFEAAARRTASRPEQRYLRARASRLAGAEGPSTP